MLKNLSILLLLVGLKHVICCVVPGTSTSTCEPAFDAPGNGSVSCTNDNFNGSTCTFACNKGYDMVGANNSVCILDRDGMGNWTNKHAPTCELIPSCTDASGKPISTKPFEKPGDCHHYYECSAGILDTMACANGTVFNPKLEACDWPCNVPSCYHPSHGLSAGATKFYLLEKTSRKGSFKECQIMCTEKGGTLAQYSLSSGFDYKNDLVEIAGAEPMWIGVNNKNDEHQWRYTSIDDGNLPFPTYTTTSLVGKWRPGQPTRVHQLCATIYEYEYDLLFSTFICEPTIPKKLYGICELP